MRLAADDITRRGFSCQNRAVDDGFFKILGSLDERDGKTIEELAFASGEAPSVIKAMLDEKSKWFEESFGRLKRTEAGSVAYDYELRGRTPRPIDEELVDAYQRYARRRGPARSELDQVYATAESALDRARLLIERGETQRGLCLLGDDDLTSLALGLLGVTRKVSVLEIDEALVSLLRDSARELELERSIEPFDLREPIPRALRGKFGAVFTDPPYALEGFTLFIQRAHDLLRPDGRLIVSFGQSRRAAERGVQKQAALIEAGFFIEEALPSHTRYEGAVSIGARSSLYFCRKTPLRRRALEDRLGGDLYSSRSPKKAPRKDQAKGEQKTEGGR